MTIFKKMNTYGCKWWEGVINNFIAAVYWRHGGRVWLLGRISKSSVPSTSIFTTTKVKLLLTKCYTFFKYKQRYIQSLWTLTDNWCCCPSHSYGMYYHPMNKMSVTGSNLLVSLLPRVYSQRDSNHDLRLVQWSK